MADLAFDTSYKNTGRRRSWPRQPPPCATCSTDAFALADQRNIAAELETTATAKLPVTQAWKKTNPESLCSALIVRPHSALTLRA
jgi:hypothetical protein